MSLDNNGEMQEDKFWLVVTKPEYEFELGSQTVQPVTLRAVTLNVYKDATKYAAHYKKIGIEAVEKWIGRRINDRVELFEPEDPGLRAQLESKGCTVRTYAAERENKKFPKFTHKAIMGGEKNTLMKKCMEFLHLKIAGVEYMKNTEIEFGLLGDVQDVKQKMLAIVRVREAEYDEYKKGELATLTMTDPFGYGTLVCTPIGEIKDSTPSFDCEEQVAKSFFDSLGKLESFKWMDKAKGEEEAEQAAAKAQKKQDKKHRRRMTESTIASPSEASFATMSTESDEVVKARQREKQNEKRKKQKERRKEEKEREEKAAFMKSLDDDANDDSKTTTSDGQQSRIQLIRILTHSMLEQNDRAKDSDSDSSPTESTDSAHDSGMDVVHVNGTDDINQVTKNRPGPIIMATPEALKGEGGVEYSFMKA